MNCMCNLIHVKTTQTVPEGLFEIYKTVLVTENSFLESEKLIYCGKLNTKIWHELQLRCVSKCMLSIVMVCFKNFFLKLPTLKNYILKSFAIFLYPKKDESNFWFVKSSFLVR